MRSHTILAFAATLGISAVTAQDYGDFDYPSACQSVCQPVNDRADSCDDQFNTDSDELTCLCTGPGMSQRIPECQACVSQNQGSDDDDDLNEINQLLSACNLATTTAGPSPTLAGPTTGSPTGSLTVLTTVLCHTDSDDGDVDCDTERLTATIGQPLPQITVYTTTSTDTDDDDNETDVDTDLVTSTIYPTGSLLTTSLPTGSLQTTLITSTDGNGATSVLTSTSMIGSPAQTGSVSTGFAMPTAVPVLGAGMGAVIAAIAGL